MPPDANRIAPVAPRDIHRAGAGASFRSKLIFYQTAVRDGSAEPPLGAAQRYISSVGLDYRSTVSAIIAAGNAAPRPPTWHRAHVPLSLLSCGWCDDR